MYLHLDNKLIDAISNIAINSKKFYLQYDKEYILNLGLRIDLVIPREFEYID